MLPAKEVKNVRAFFVIKLFKLNEIAVKKLIAVLQLFAFFFSSFALLYGFVSS